jgi:transcriptional regulator with XRE-family HTH domain
VTATLPIWTEMRPAKIGTPAPHQPVLELLEPLEAAASTSPFAGARARRQLTVEETARRAGLTRDQVVWLESGRVYAFRTPEDALAAALLLAAALEVDMHTARELVGLPTLPRSLAPNPRGRLFVVALIAIVALAAAASGYVLRGGSVPGRTSNALPPPATIAVPVLNGGGDVNYARRIATTVKDFGYAVPRVTPAPKFNYPETAVYYGPHEKRVGARLASQLCVPLKPLGRGSNPDALVVIAGPPRLSNC